jgi:hypothetical protein
MLQRNLVLRHGSRQEDAGHRVLEVNTTLVRFPQIEFSFEKDVEGQE